MPDVVLPYPGEQASPERMLMLADEYRSAALNLLERGRRGKPLSWAPFRLTAIQAIELYLNVFLLQNGHSPAQVRGMQHDLDRRAKSAIDAGLRLRRRTADHLHRLSVQREYLVTRYAPEQVASASQINRLNATLEEVAKKVSPAAAARSSKAA